jgi:hypothetical protein
VSEAAHLRERLRELELRAARAYRSYAQRAAARQDVYALWADVARHREECARMLMGSPDEPHAPHQGPASDGGEGALATVEECVLAAERLVGRGRVDARLMAALNLEVTDLHVRRQMGLAYGEQDQKRGLAIAVRLATMVSLYSDDVHLFVEAAELIAGARRASQSLRRAP